MSVIVKLLSKFDDSGIKKAKSSFGGLGKALGAVGIGIGISQITSLLMDSAKAASADAKSTQLLNTQLQRNAHATKDQIKQSDKFIEKLSLQTGIFDDDLRPAYAKFANVTHNVKDAQKLLTITVDAAAGSGKSQTKIANAVAKAYDGNTKALIGMFPELKKSKNVLGDFTKEYQGMAEINADPFKKFNNSMDILKEKLGNAILPLISEFVDYLSKRGGIVDQVGSFLDQLSNPKSEPGKMFVDIKNAVKDAFGYVKDFFALFGNGDAMKGFANVAGSLVKALPALLALKGILMLASAGKSLVNLVAAISALRGTGGGGIVGGGGGGAVAAGAGAGKGLFSKLTGVPVVGTVAAILTMSGDTLVKAPRDLTGIDPKTGAPYNVPHLFGKPAQNPLTTNNNITINVQSADPKAVVDALGKYVKGNGKLPPSLFPGVKP